MRTRVFAALLSGAMVIAVAACGSSSKTSTAPNTPEQRKADKAIAQQAVLKLSDMPPGYKATPHQDSPEDDISDATLKKFATCAKAPKAMIDNLFNDTDRTEPSADSPDFEQGDASTGFQLNFENNVEIDRSAEDLSDQFDILAAKSALPCWKALFKSAFEDTAPSGGSLQDLAVEPISIRDVGDQSAAFGIRATLSGVVTITAYLDFYLVRSGRAAISLFASGIGKKVDRSLEQSLVQTVADRLEGTT